MRNGDIFEPLVSAVSPFVLLPHDGKGGCTVDSLMKIIRLCEKFDVALPISLEWLVAFVRNADRRLPL
jgi:hypothetical protein